MFAQAQNLSIHQSFFEKQLPEYNAWMKSIGIDAIATTKAVQAYNSNVVFYLQSVFATDDSLKVAWKAAQDQYYKKYRGRIGERLFDQLAFLYDLELDELEIIILGNQYSNTNIRIYHRDNYLQIEENFPNFFGASDIIIKKDLFEKDFVVPIGKLNVNALVDENGQRVIAVDKIRAYLGDYLQKYYSDKGTTWYKAHIDTDRTYYNKMIYRVTCLNNEIIQDGFFEYIQIKVEVAEQGEEVLVKFDLLGKYASGLICPKQKTKFYKSMETYYPNELKDYAEYIHDKLENHLRKYP